MELVLGFWVMCAIVYILISWLVEQENMIAHLVVGVFIAILFYQKVLTVTPVINSPLRYLIDAVMWVLAGLIWSYPRWFIQVGRWKTKCIEGVEERKRAFLRSKNLAFDDLSEKIIIPAEFLEEYRGYVKYDGNSLPPNIRTDYPIVISWVTYWPASIGAWLVRSPIRRLVKFIFVRCLGRHFNNISRKAAAEVASHQPV